MRFIKTIIKIILSYLLLVPFAWALNAPKCLETLNRIYSDFKKYPAITEQHLSWMKVAWLKNNLGEPAIKKNADGQTEYRWQCSNTNNFITTTMTSDGKTNYAMIGTTQINGKNWNFGINFDESSSFETVENKTTVTIPPKLTPPPIAANTNTSVAPPELPPHVTTLPPKPLTVDTTEMKKPNPEAVEKLAQSMQEAIKKLLDKSLPEYNQKYGTHINNVKDLEADMKARINDFGDKFLTCTPGHYEYASVFFKLIYITTTIKDKQGDLCLTETSFSLGNGDIFMSCKIPMHELPALKDSFAQVTEASITAATKAANDTQGDILGKYCTSKITITGQKKP